MDACQGVVDVADLRGYCPLLSGGNFVTFYVSNSHETQPFTTHGVVAGFVV